MDAAGEKARNKSSQYAYLDLLATTLTEHEKNMDRFVERLEKILENLSKIGKAAEHREPFKAEKVTPKEEAPASLVYMRLKINRPVEELKIILDSLKE